METIACIKTRRSRRKFLDKDIPDELLEKIIDAGKYAPSSMNSQPWEFIIVKGNEIKKKLAELKGKDNEECLLGAKVIIIVCVDMEKSATRWVEDGVCAAINILLAIHELGLGAVYVTGYNNKEPEITDGLKKALNLPEKIMPVVLIPLGYPDPNEKIEEKELRGIKEITHIDSW